MAEESAGTILIVDDERSLLTVMEQYLRRLHYEVVACVSGKEAWERFSAHPSDYSLVLADIVMPDMSGREMLLRMLERNPNVGILICSGYPFDLATLPAEYQGQVGFLQKPFSPRMLADAVQKLIARNRAST